MIKFEDAQLTLSCLLITTHFLRLESLKLPFTLLLITFISFGAHLQGTRFTQQPLILGSFFAIINVTGNVGWVGFLLCVGVNVFLRYKYDYVQETSGPYGVGYT